jgi:hypothetical protein
MTNLKVGSSTSFHPKHNLLIGFIFAKKDFELRPVGSIPGCTREARSSALVFIAVRQESFASKSDGRFPLGFQVAPLAAWRLGKSKAAQHFRDQPQGRARPIRFRQALYRLPRLRGNGRELHVTTLGQLPVGILRRF